MDDGAKPRRGWRETVAPGLYRAHRVSCPRSEDHREGGRCSCPWQLKAPGTAPGQTRTVTFHGTPREAKEERRRLLAAGRPEPPPEHHADLVTVHDLVGDYMRAHAGVLAPATLRGHDEAYRRSIAPHLGAMPVRDLTRPQVVGWLASVARTTSAHGTWKARTALRTFLKHAVERGLIDENPVAGIRAPRHHREADTRKAPSVLDRGALDGVIAACPDLRSELLIRMSAEAGLRRGEIIGLRWEDIDTDAREVRVARTVTQESGRRRHPPTRTAKAPKSGHAQVVALAPTTAELLSEYRAAITRDGEEPVGWVFPGRTGGPMDAGTPRRVLTRACKAAGLVDGDGHPLVTWHGLRHTAASLMLAAGVPLTDVAAQLRHADPSITARVYSHSLGRDAQHAAASVFDPPPTPESTGGDTDNVPPG